MLLQANQRSLQVTGSKLQRQPGTKGNAKRSARLTLDRACTMFPLRTWPGPVANSPTFLPSLLVKMVRMIEGEIYNLPLWTGASDVATLAGKSMFQM